MGEKNNISFILVGDVDGTNFHTSQENGETGHKGRGGDKGRAI